MENTDTKKEDPEEDDWFVFIPSKAYHSFGRVIEKLNEAQREFRKVTDTFKVD